MVVMKNCPSCGTALAWPVGAQGTTCPGCGKGLLLDRPVPPRSNVGQQVMIVGLVVVALGLVLAVLSAL